MKKIATTIALSALFMTGVMDNADASIFTWNNKVTDNQLKSKYGESYKKQTKALYDDFIKAKRLFERKAKESKVQSNQDVKAVITLLDKTAAAVKDVYQAEKGTIIIESANKTINYYNQNQGAYSSAKRILGNNLQQFEDAFKNLSVPQATDYTGDISSKVAEVFNIIVNLKNQMTDQTVQAPVAQTQVVSTHAPAVSATSSSDSSSNNGNWMFEKKDTATNTATPQTPIAATSVKTVTPATQVVTPQTTIQPQTPTATTTVKTPVVQTNTASAPVKVTTPATPVITQPVVQQPTRGAGRRR